MRYLTHHWRSLHPTPASTLRARSASLRVTIPLPLCHRVVTRTLGFAARESFARGKYLLEVDTVEDAHSTPRHSKKADTYERRKLSLRPWHRHRVGTLLAQLRRFCLASGGGLLSTSQPAAMTKTTERLLTASRESRGTGFGPSMLGLDLRWYHRKRIRARPSHSLLTLSTS